MESGTRLGHFEVLGPLGRGGMGEVFRAHDSRLSREVALKFLPDALSSDADRVARFEREARVLASLNHAHIAAVYGFEQAGSHRFLVLELVPGPTLAERLNAGAIDWREALQIARQIAEGLEEAHAKGVIHRDLKPANIKITPDGQVKVLDFGLAKVLSTAAPAAFGVESPTMVPTAESAGLILGTAGYMSPEQARGQEVDKRTDIWAFGCVLYEMLSGRQLFTGTSTTDVLSAILTAEPDWTQLPPRTPPVIRSLLRKCLQKDKSARLHDIADARLDVEEALSAETSGTISPSVTSRPPQVPQKKRVLTHALSFIVGSIVAAAAMSAIVRPQPPEAATVRFNIALPPGARLELVGEPPAPIHLSRDARQFVYVARAIDGQTQILVRRMDRLAPEPIPGTTNGNMPFLSPDGAWLGFAQDGKLKRIPLNGGQSAVICDAPDPRGASWGDDDTILLAPNNGGGLFRVRASGGSPEPVTQPDAAKQEDSHRWPLILPGSKVALFSVQTFSGRESQRRIDALNLTTGERRTVVQGGSYPMYADGLLFFGRGGHVLAVPFSPERLEVSGEPRLVLDDVRMNRRDTGIVYFDIAQTGTAVYVAPFQRPRDRSLVYMDRSGRATPVITAKRPFVAPVVSPDGRRIAVKIDTIDNVDLWIIDIASGTFNRLTFEGDVNTAEWTADSRALIYTANVDGPRSVYRIAADGTGKPELVFRRTEWWIDEAVPRPDGSGTLISAQDRRGGDLYFLPTGTRQPQPFLVTPAEERNGVFSPNGTFVAYSTNESNRFDAYVRAFSTPVSKRQISTVGGVLPSWSPDGREIFYWELGSTIGRLMQVSFEPGDEPRVGTPHSLFEVPLGTIDRVSLMPDGQHFLLVQREPEVANPPEVVVIPKFLDEIAAPLNLKPSR